MFKLPASTMFKIFLRDQNQCITCRRGAEDGVELKIHHITPSAAGGTNSIHNLRTLCFDCAQLSYNKTALVYAPLKKHNRIPPEYALGMLVQALRGFRSKHQKQEISLEEATIAANNPEFIRGVNPLFSPLPKAAILAAVLAMHEEGKIQISGNMIKI
ncbi:MAG: HNH endonuclease [Candidatus Micrarchaeota archaeon]